MKTTINNRKTMADVKALNRVKGNYFFDPDTMRFWHSKVHGGLILGKYFITSEDNYDRMSRLFSIRAINWTNGAIDTVGAFQQFHTVEDAKEFIKSLEGQ